MEAEKQSRAEQVCVLACASSHRRLVVVVVVVNVVVVVVVRLRVGCQAISAILRLVVYYVMYSINLSHASLSDTSCVG